MSVPAAQDETYGSDTTEYDVQTIRALNKSWKPVVTVVSGRQIGKTLILEERCTVIGRDSCADLLLIGSGISRQHAQIECRDDGQVIVHDLNSTNGIRLNGNLVTDAPLEPGDKVQLGPETVIKYRIEDPDEVAARVQQYEHSIRDHLTGIHNRRYFAVTLERELSYIGRRDMISSLVLLDIDHFKAVNDRFGHRGGDQVLKLLTKTVSTYVREQDVFARWGGEEFVLLLRGTDVGRAHSIAERIRIQLEGLRIKCADPPLSITASFGVAAIDLNRHDTIEAAMHEVDGNLYKAKNNGRNQTVSG